MVFQKPLSWRGIPNFYLTFGDPFGDDLTFGDTEFQETGMTLAWTKLLFSTACYLQIDGQTKVTNRTLRIAKGYGEQEVEGLGCQTC